MSQTPAAARARATETGAAGYIVAVLAVALALALRLALSGTFGLRVPYFQFYPAVIVAAWYGGLGPGALATVLSALAAMYVLLPPDGIAVGDLSDQLSLGVFIGTGLVLAWLNHRLRLAEEGHRASAATANARAERLDAILNTTVDGIVVIDAQGVIEAFNRGAESLFEYSAAEVTGRNVSVLMPSPHHEAHDEYLARYLDTGQAKIIGVGREVTGRRRDGTLFPVHLSVAEMRIAGERKFTGLLHDLTKRSRLQGQLGASEARWRAVIDSAVDGILVIDIHGRIESFNPAAERLFGYRAPEVLGQNVEMLMPSPYRDEHDTYLARYLETGRATIIGRGREVQGRRKDGATFPLHLSVGEITIEGNRKFTGIVHDLSSRVQLEEQLREHASLARLGEMAAVIAHEVKNPLAGIRGVIQVFSDRLARDGTQAEILKDILTRIDSLDRLMKDLLLYARPPKPKRVATDVAALLSSTATLLSRDPTFRDVDVEIGGEPLTVQADAEMLRIVFQNLLINGAHAMQGRGKVHVEVARSGAMCEMAFSDAGPGIPADIREKIFTPFFTTKSRGSGLGLPTVKRLVEAHGGQVSIDCPADGGTTVLIRLPLEAPQPRETAAAGSRQ